MVFDRVVFNVLDGEYYIKDEGTSFDRFLNMFNTKKFYQKILYRGIFYTIVGISKITHKCKTYCIVFD